MVTTNIKEHSVKNMKKEKKKTWGKKTKQKLTAIVHDSTSCQGVVPIHQALHENLTDQTSGSDER